MTRLVDQQTAISFLEYDRDHKVSSNTEIYKKTVILFGNKIAWKACKQIMPQYNNKIKVEPLIISMCGYGTQTTRERLNAILEYYISTCDFQWCHSNLIDRMYIKQENKKQFLVVKYQDKEDLSEIKNLDSEINISEFLLEFIDHRFKKGTAMLKEKPIKIEIEKPIHESQWVRVRDYA